MAEPGCRKEPAHGKPIARGGQRRPSADERWRAIFEERHGQGSYERLIVQLQQPCITFAEIAKRLDVSRERVRQWHVRLMPDAPRGHARKRLCRARQQKRRLLENPLFRSFYQHARAHVAPGRIELIQASDGYRTRAVWVDRALVALRTASRSAAVSPDQPAAPVYALSQRRGPADFIYYRLTQTDYLFLPKGELPLRGGATFVDHAASRYAAYKNTFAALRGAARSRTA